MKELTAYGQFIKRKQKELNISMNELCLRCFTSQKSMSDCIRGRAYPTSLTIIKIREGLHLSGEETLQMLDAIEAGMVEDGKLDEVIDDE